MLLECFCNSGLNGIGGNSNSQHAISSTLANLSGVTKSQDGRRRLCMSDQFSVLNTGVNATKLVQQVRQMLALSVANDLPVSISVDATQWCDVRNSQYRLTPPRSSTTRRRNGERCAVAREATRGSL